MSLRSLHDRLITLLAEGVTERVYTTASVAVWRAGQPIILAATHDPADVFDVASVTKVATAALTLRHMALDVPQPWIDGSPTPRDMLCHRSGLPAWRPFFALAAEKLSASLPDLISRPELHQLAKLVTTSQLQTTRASSPRPTYSDLNFLSLGFSLEEYTELSLPDLARRELFVPLELSSMQWGGAQPTAVPTGLGRPRPGNPTVESEALGATPFDASARDQAVDDDNAASMGGQCGHAGLWSNATDLAHLGDALRQCAEGTSETPLDRSRAVQLFRRVAESRTCGLDTPSGISPAIGTLLGRGPKGAAGHLGFTGCSLWIDRDAELSIALLSNAVAVERPNPRIRAFRPRVHELIARELGLGA